MALRNSLVPQTHLYMGDTQGRPLDSGLVYFGEPNKDPELYPINTYYDEALSVAAAQPITTKGGFLNANGDMAEVYAAEVLYSVKVMDKYGRLVFYKPEVTTPIKELTIDSFGARPSLSDNTSIIQNATANGVALVPDGNYLANKDSIDMSKLYGTGKINGELVGYPSTSEKVQLDKPTKLEAPAIITSLQDEIRDGSFNVKRMGAKGSLSFDSTTAFLKAQEEAAFLGAKTLYVPASENPYNISESLLKVSQGNKGIGLVGEGIGMTRLRWVGGAGRLIDAFSEWQYGFEMSGFTLESEAGLDGSGIATGSVGLHIEKNQTPATINNILVTGFDTNIDIGIHAQFVHWQNIASRFGNTLLNAYGQNADMNVFDNCMFYSGKNNGVLLSAPRAVMRDCWFGTSNAFSTPEYVDITIGFQQVRAEDIGKSSSTGNAQLGHSAQHASLIRPRFERGTSGINTAPYIVFKNIDERTSATPLSPFTIDNPVMPNIGASACISVQDNRDGLRIINPEKNNDIKYLVDVATQTDGSVQYIDVSGNRSGKVFKGQNSLVSFDESFFYDSEVVDKTATLTAGSTTTLTHDAISGFTKAVKANDLFTSFITTVRPSSTNNAKFYIKATGVDATVVDVAVYAAGQNYKLRMRNIPISKLKKGVSISIPESIGMALTLAITVPSKAETTIIIEKVLYNN